MTTEKKRSYRNIIDSFLGTPKQSDLYKLNVYAREILRVIARYLDMPLGACFGKQTTLAKECGMSERQFRNSSNELIKKGLITREKGGKLYHYYLSTDTGILCR